MLEDNATVTADAQLVREFEVNEASVAAQIRNGAAARSDIAGGAVSNRAGARKSRNRARHRHRRAGDFATTLGLDADAQGRAEVKSPRNRRRRTRHMRCR